MQNCTEIDYKCQINTLFKIASNSDISDIFGDLVPYPHLHYFDHSINRMVYGWYLNGFFETKNNTKYLNELIARFMISCDCKLHSVEKTDETNNPEPLKLKAFQGLKSLAKDGFKRDSVKSLINGDYIYTCIVLQAEKFIKSNGIIVYSQLEDWAFEHFIDIAKDKGTLKAKCKNCWNWYLDRNWELYHTKRIKKDEGEVMATRLAHIEKVNENRKKETKAKIENAITGLLAESMFKKKNGKWNAKAIADYLNLQPKTVNKYLKEIL